MYGEQQNVYSSTTVFSITCCVVMVAIDDIDAIERVWRTEMPC